MKLSQAILLFLSAAFLIIAGYESLMLQSLQESYWLFMISVALFLWYAYNKRKDAGDESHK